TGCREGIPLATEEVLALAFELPRPGVTRVQVERMALVRHLGLPVLPLRRPEEPRLHARSGAELPLLHERRPVVGTLAVTGAVPVLVLHEQVERPAGARGEHLANLRLVQRDSSSARAARGGALVCDGRCRGDARGGEGDPQRDGQNDSFQHLSSYWGR